MGNLYPQKIADLRIVIDTARKIKVTPREAILIFLTAASMGFRPNQVAEMFVDRFNKLTGEGCKE
jgi:hypothetical protein